jgi:hypothetical protein
MSKMLGSKCLPCVQDRPFNADGQWKVDASAAWSCSVGVHISHASGIRFVVPTVAARNGLMVAVNELLDCADNT